ncbi:transcriptional regulator CtsR [Clostridium cavendishii DSM 21758]|uniref:Transcriptional regulator CtsR n=1 Tax=Clostridium cavendishii DSM 21758 TaxID=1121302 RepID=A0A1M6V0X1_9CLOT|nr:CtsR family transcriptional regulator [Clostridium cavendishii]SHK75103.1 transcriptional regulator CtsR [Clostridium cavendishii DSM 21758]
MARLSDIIEQFIKSLIEESNSQELQIQRNELADKFSCAPSQINYVLTTRFTYDKGYLIESKRGGGGHIVIRRVNYDNKQLRNKIINQTIGESITYNGASVLLEGMFANELIDRNTFEIMKITLNDRTLQNVPDKNKVRADILSAIIMVLLA